MAGAIKVTPGARVSLDDVDPADTGSATKKRAAAHFAALDSRLGELQELLYAARQHAILIVLQGLDTSGKDGTIRHVLGSVNPQGVRVESFKVPTPEEAAHDFMWRAHRVTPPLGTMTIFNRSYYEDVLVVRVHDLVPDRVWRGRYDQINAFEALLASSGTIVVKFYLHISKEEQRKRLLAREDEREKTWKLSPQDWVERRSWGEYVGAYEDALAKCSTEVAPWYVIPADHKWYRNLLIAQTLVDVLEPHAAAWRKHVAELGRDVLDEVKRERQAEEPGHGKRKKRKGNHAAV